MIGDRIRQFRLARGMSLEELATAIGNIVTRQSLHKYEKGQAKPSAVVLNRIAKVLQVNPLNLWQEPTAQIELVAYRKHAKMSKGSQESVQSLVATSLEERIRLQKLLELEIAELPVRAFRIDSVEDAERAAAELRGLWNLGVDAICSLTTVLEDHQIHVIEIEADEKFDGLSAIAEEDGKMIAAAVVTRQGVPGDRQRLNLGHELGHIVLDIAEGVDEEKAAFRFAGAFLAPIELLQREVGTHRTAIGLAELELLKKKVGLSVQALLHRLHDINIISDEHYNGWWTRIGQYGWRRKELGEPLAPERAQWLQSATLRALAEGLISSQDARTLIGDLVPEAKIPFSLAEKRAFLQLPETERRRILQEQAQSAAEEYRSVDWKEWEAADTPLPAYNQGVED